MLIADDVSMPELTKEQLYIILGIIFILLTGCIVGVYSRNSGEKQTSPESSLPPVLLENKQKTEDQAILVHISGAVNRQGLYKMAKSDRLIDLLRLSGVSKHADLDSVNLSAPLSDGQRIFIPSKRGDVAQISPVSGAEKTSSKTVNKVNINSADEKGLDSLPGIGPTMAKKIFEHRKEKGIFSNIEELKEVQGISQKKFDKLKPYITVN
jgi:competence protein ComEA